MKVLEVKWDSALSDYFIHNIKKKSYKFFTRFLSGSDSSQCNLPVPEEDTAVETLAQGGWE